MASDLTLIVEMATVIGAATAGGYVASRLKQPVLLGYLLGGMLVGPKVLRLVTLEGDISVLAEIGVELLLFALGVEFSLKDLLRMRRIAIGGGTLQIVLTLLLGGGLAYATGWASTIPKAVFLGAVLSLSSTAVVLKSLLERNEVNSAHGQIMLAILIVQDLGLGILLAVLPVLTRPPEEIGTALLIALFKVTAFLICAIMAGKWVIPRLVRAIARQGSQELFLLGILGLCLGIALITSAIGLGIEMGAFVAGVMVSNVEYADHALDRVLPMRDVFATLFFASIGLLIDPLFLLENIWVLAGLVAIAMVGKALIVTSIVRVFGYPLRTALTVGMGLNQIGEFSFVLAGVAQTSGVFTERLYGLVVGTTAVTLLLTPFVLRLTPRLLLWMERSPSLNPLLQAKSPTLVGFEENELTDHVIVAGFGRVGQTLVRMLDFQQHQILVIDNDEGVLQSLRDRKIPYLLGDVSSMLVLEKANLSKARTMAITLPDPMATRLTLNRALSLAPELDITARAHVNTEIDTLYQLGAQEVVQPEFEAALEMGAHTLLKLGDSAYMVQQLVNRYRNRRYRDIVPKREEYWGSRQLELAVEGLDHRWYELDNLNSLVGKTIVESNLRKLTGATIIAIERKSRLRRYPLGSTTFKAGDRLLVVGNPEEQDAFNQLFHEVKA